MNKKRVNDWILTAKEAIKDNEIPKNGVVDKTFRGQIATFGAAVVMGSLKSAVAFFSEQNKSTVDRPKLIQAMYQKAKNQKRLQKIYFSMFVTMTAMNWLRSSQMHLLS